MSDSKNRDEILSKDYDDLIEKYVNGKENKAASPSVNEGEEASGDFFSISKGDEASEDFFSVSKGEEAPEEFFSVSKESDCEDVFEISSASAGDDFFEISSGTGVFGEDITNLNADEPKKATPPPFKVNMDGDTGPIEGIFPEKEKTKFQKLSDWYNNLPKKKKIIVSVVAIILALIITLTTVLGIFVAQKFGLMGDNVGNGDDIVYEDENFGSIDIDIGSSDFKQSLIDWATTGNDMHMSSKNVINVLLVGADSRNGTNSGNTDVMMLLSVNKKTKQLKLVSFLRDSYLYVQGKNNSYCTKLNAAFSMGGPECLMQTIENNYKIDIDNYVMVNFESFEAIIDAMGGVTVDVKKYEADYNYTKFKINLPYGEDVTLNGEQALCFCRIRGCDADGDVSRTRRQRQVIDAIIDRVKTASLGDLNKYIDILLPYVDTGYSKSQILSTGMKALTGKWFSYERTQLQAPDEECRTSGSANAWIWVVDYQLAAQKLQMELYGQSNITIDEGRLSIIDVYNGASYSSGNSSFTPSPTNSPSTTVLHTTVQKNDNTVTTTEKVDATTAPVTQKPTEAVSGNVNVTDEDIPDINDEDDVTEDNGMDITPPEDDTTQAPAPQPSQAQTEPTSQAEVPDTEAPTEAPVDEVA